MHRLGAVLLAAALAGCSASASVESTRAGTRATRAAQSQAVAAKATPSPTASPRKKKHFYYVYPVRRCASSPSSSHHDYPAADIFTHKGCHFVATTSGVVDEVGRRDRWKPSVDSGATRGGRYVSIIGNDGVRYYGSHLLKVAKNIKPGVHVHAGELLGLIDNSGDAKYTPTHVHYGISWPTRHGVWWVRRGEVWPQRYLRAWRNGNHGWSPRYEVRKVHRRMGTVPKCQAEC